MLQINFHPESDDPNFEKAAKEYAGIWENDGEKIILTIEKISGLKFRTKIINAVTFNGRSYSLPMRLQCANSFQRKKAVLIHELCHRLWVDNKIKIPKIKDHDDFVFQVHKIIDLILFDIWVELYGEKFAKENVKAEKSFGNEQYIKAWEETLKLNMKERKKEFDKLKLL